MKNLVLCFEKFINESSNDTYISIVRDTLLNNKTRIMAEAEISDEVFNLVLDKMISKKPDSLREESLINDAIVYSREIAKTVEVEDVADDLQHKLEGTIPQFQN